MTLERVRVCKRVPAFRATGPDIARGGLRLADPGVR
jgi:hypothetical protein